jgi:phosphatidylinositol-3-phosphatase
MHPRRLLVALTAALVVPALCTTGTSAAAVPVTKVLVVVEENHSLAEMAAGMPYTFALARRYGYATDYRAISHPSLPNYIAIAGGSSHGITDDNPPGYHPVAGSSIFGQAWAAGRSARVYAESAVSNCQPQDGGAYAVRHNPWPYFTGSGERARCASEDVPFTAFPHDVAVGALPTVGFVVPNVCNDAHDCSLTTADDWFRRLMAAVFAGPDWRSGHLAVVLTADEDDGSNPANTVLTVVLHPSQYGHVVRSPLTHYSLTRLCEDVAHVPHLYEAAVAPSLSAAFGLPIG